MDCKICFEPYDESSNTPVVLGCAHTICFKCASSLVRPANGVAGTLVCPFDQQSHSIPLPVSEKSFKKNFSVIEIIQQQKQSFNSTIGNCFIHPTFEMNAFCVNCKKPICVACLTGLHAGHSTQLIDEFVSMSKQQLRSRRSFLETSLKDAERDVQESNDSASELLNKVIEDFIKSLQELVTNNQLALEKWRTPLVSELQQIESGIALSTAQFLEFSNTFALSENKAFTGLVLNKKMAAIIIKDIFAKYSGVIPVSSPTILLTEQQTQLRKIFAPLNCLACPTCSRPLNEVPARSVSNYLQVVCDLCSHRIVGFTHRCSSCNFDVCNECLQQCRDELAFFCKGSHTKILMCVTNIPHDGIISRSISSCSKCSNPLKDLFLWCPDCEIADDGCCKLGPSSLSFVFCKNYRPLIRVNNPAGKKDAFCSFEEKEHKFGSYMVYSCNCCGTSLCDSCYAMARSSVCHKGHSMNVFSTQRDIIAKWGIVRCTVCRLTARDSVSHCLVCLVCKEFACNACLPICTTNRRCPRCPKVPLLKPTLLSVLTEETGLYGNGMICDVCRGNQNSGSILHCDCNYDLCLDCAKPNKCIFCEDNYLSFFNASKLTEESRLYSEGFACNICKGCFHTGSYHCSTCTADFCPTCFVVVYKMSCPSCTNKLVPLKKSMPTCMCCKKKTSCSGLSCVTCKTSICGDCSKKMPAPKKARFSLF